MQRHTQRVATSPPGAGGTADAGAAASRRSAAGVAAARRLVAGSAARSVALPTAAAGASSAGYHARAPAALHGDGKHESWHTCTFTLLYRSDPQEVYQAVTEAAVCITATCIAVLNEALQ